MTSAFSIKLELLTNELLAAGTDQEREVVAGKIKTLQEYEQLLADPSPSKKISSKAAKTPGKKSYDESQVIKCFPEFDFTFTYRQYVEGNKEAPTATIKASALGFIKAGNNQDLNLAIKIHDTALDVVQGKIYAMACKSLRDFVVGGV